MRELIKRPNVELHDFQTDRKYVLDPQWYCDVQHFSNDAAGKILEDLSLGHRRIRTVEEIRENELSLRQLIKEIMPQFHKEITQHSLKKGKK
jgi:hypothetical protein